MANFGPPPFPFFPFRHLQPELIPVTVPTGSFTVGVGAGVVTAGGTATGLTLGQGINVGAGTLTAAGAPGALSLGSVAGFNVGAGQITAFGYSIGVGPVVSTPSVPFAETGAFAPALSELGIDAWERVGKQAGELTNTHIASMRRSANFVLTRWSNRGINLWRVINTVIPLVPGQATYGLDPTIIEVLDTYISTGIAPNTTDIIITPMSRNTYAALPNKNQAGRPILYWFDRTITPTITVWPVPDTSTPYSMPFFSFSQVADMDFASGNTANLPYRFLEAFTAALAAHLAIKWAPAERAVALDAYSKEVWQEASDEDREVVTTTIAPDLSAYFG